MDPTENLNKIQQDILDLSAKLHQMTEDNSSWFGNLLQFQPGKIITRKNFTDPNCMFCFCVSMQLHISNTEHVQCACNDYKLQELTFKCLNLYFVRVIRTLKGGMWNYKLCLNVNLDIHFLMHFITVLCLNQVMLIGRDSKNPDVDSKDPWPRR